MVLQLQVRAQSAPGDTRNHLVLELHGLAWRHLPALFRSNRAWIAFITIITIITTTTTTSTAIFATASIIATNTFDYVIWRSYRVWNLLSTAIAYRQKVRAEESVPMMTCTSRSIISRGQCCDKDLQRSNCRQ